MKKGVASAIVSAIVRFCARIASSGAPAAKALLISGRSTVPAAIPITPIGNW